MYLLEQKMQVSTCLPVLPDLSSKWMMLELAKDAFTIMIHSMASNVDA